jgi:pyrroloquinoline quinone biosynthesis protein D
MTARSWRPALPPGAMLRSDPIRGQEVLLMPERVVVLHGSARSVLDLCDGQRTVDDITARLTQQHPEHTRREEIARFLTRLHAQGCLR